MPREGWRQVDIAGKRADVFDPKNPPRYALLWLHERPVQWKSEPERESSGIAHFALSTHLEKHRLACIVPHVKESWWVDRICPEFDTELTAEKHILANVIAWVTEWWKLPTRSISVAGIEMGGQGAVRLGLRHPSIFRAVASLGGAIDFHELYSRGTPLDDMYDTRERARQDTATLHMHPSEWPPHLWFACAPDNPWFRGNDRLHEKLRAYGVPHTADLETDGNLESMLEFVVNGLEKESRRLM